jgi:hypothetical protein
MSIGEIITTPTGLAVVTAVLPQTISVGNQTFVQVVSQPLTGGPSAAVSASPPGLIAGLAGGGIPYRSLAAQAATAYVAYVEEETQQQLVAEATKGAIAAQSDVAALFGGTSSSGSGSGSNGTSDTGSSGSGGSEYIGGAAAYFSASKAYQTAQTLQDDTGPSITLFG